MRLIFTLAFIHAAFVLVAQETAADSSTMLQEVVIEAFETNRQLAEVPASVGYLKAAEFQRYSNTSILPAVNTVPGVRMEERSPGSYRFSIRGSSLRSPFGVRNIKAYWNGLPFTDGGGNTYLNLLDFGSIGTLEIIKGPGGSLYGAGTGGVLLMKSPEVKRNQIQAGAVFGSYGLQRYRLGAQLKNESVRANIQVAHHQSDGYREQTAMKRDVLNADVKFRAGEKGTLSSTVILSNLRYETPGGLNLSQFKANPRQARPPSASLGAVEARAAVSNKTIFGGVVYDYDWNSEWATTAGLYGGFSRFANPTIRNYEKRDETNVGIRTHTRYRLSEKGKITLGAEYQYFTSPIGVFGNTDGKADTVQVRDEVSSEAGLVFAQADVELPHEFFLTAGASVNFLRYDFLRVEPLPQVKQRRNFDAVFSPRIALLKKLSPHISMYTGYSDGFSPPSLAEVRPSTNTFNNGLKAESGNNLELGARGAGFKGRFEYDVVAYNFTLRNTIVVQRNDEGADYFINAGRTSQRGLEAYASFDFGQENDFFSLFKLWGSYAYQHYRFKDYQVLDEDFSGNALTGVPSTTLYGGLDLHMPNRFAANVTFSYVDHIPLDDANTAFAKPYTLLGLRAAWETTLHASHSLRIFAGVDNLLDEAYSLGNDLNAFGGRYYNAAMPRNFYAGVSIALGSEL